MWVALTCVGAVAVWLSGFRGVVVPAAGLPVTALAVTAFGLMQEVVRLPFSWATLVTVAWLSGALVGLARRLHSGHWGLSRDAGARVEDSGGNCWPVAAALAASIATAYMVMWLSTGGDLQVASQTWDAFFDANAVRAASESQVIAPTQLSAFAYAYPVINYYPSTFHGLAVLAMQATGSDAVTATNISAALLAGGLWPATVALASRYLWGGGRGVLLAAVTIAWGMHGMPWAPLGWGVLWATSLAGAAVPLVVVTFGGLLGVTRAPRDRRLAGLLFVASLALVGVLHPRVAVVTSTVLVAPWVWVFGGSAAGPAALAGMPVVLLAAAALLVGRGNGELVARAWPILQGRVSEIVQYLIGGPEQSMPRLLVATLVVAGIVLAWRERSLRWLVVLHLSAVGLDIATATTNYVPPFNAIARFWYNDRHRTIIVPPAVAVPLALLAWEWASSVARGRWGRWADAPGGIRRGVWGGDRGRRPSVSFVLAVVVGASGAIGAVSYLRPFYAKAATDPVVGFVSPREIAFYQRVAQVVPPGERVLNNPWDGSGLLYAYTGVRTVFYVLNGVPGTNAGVVLRERLLTMSHAEVCTEMKADGVQWIINGGAVPPTPSLPPQIAPGMEVPADFWATTPVLQDGDLRLYRVTGCGAH